MPKSVYIVVSLSVICLISGFSLAALNSMTKEQIELQILQNKQLPAIEKVLKTIGKADNDFLADRKSLPLDDKNKLALFPGKKGGEIFSVALEEKGKGFGGDVGIMMGFDFKTDKLIGVAITTMSETPGVGTRAKKDSFTNQFIGMTDKNIYKVKADGGDIDAVSGATVTSRAVCTALDKGFKLYKENKEKIQQTLK